MIDIVSLYSYYEIMPTRKLLFKRLVELAWWDMDVSKMVCEVTVSWEGLLGKIVFSKVIYLRMG